MTKICITINLIFYLILVQNIIFGNVQLSGMIISEEFGKTSLINEAKILVVGTGLGTYSNDKGVFKIKSEQIPLKGLLLISKFNYVPILVSYDLQNDDNSLKINIFPNYVYFTTPPLMGSELLSEPVKFTGRIFYEDNPINGVLVRLVDTPYSTVSSNDGTFSISLTIDEITLSPRKIFVLSFDIQGYETITKSYEKKEILDAFKSNKNQFDCGSVRLQKYIAPSELDRILEQKYGSVNENSESNQASTIDTSIFRLYNERISEIQKALSDLKADTQRYSQYREEIVNARLNQNKYFELLKKEHELDSIYLLSLQFLDSAISSNNNSIKNLNAIDETIATSLSELGVDITSTRNDLNKRIEESIIVFNENARILNESYLKRSRQYDTTALQVFATIPVTLGPRYPDFVSTRTFGQIGINTNFGFHFLQRSKIYTSFSYNLLSFDKKDTNYHTGADNKTLFANTENVSANFFAFAVNFRPPIDFITNLKIDPGVGLSIGYDYKKIENGKINDSVAKIGIQAYIQVVVQYKLYTPPSDFNDYNPKSFMNNQNEFNNLLGSGQIDSSKYANKYKGLYENYNYKKSKYIKRRHVFQNLGHNTYLYFAVSDRLVFNEKKYLYGLANFSLGLKFDLSSFVKNQNLLKKSCELSDYCNPGKPSD